MLSVASVLSCEMGSGSNPHDALFKAVFAQPEHAGGELRAVLPEALGLVMRYMMLVNDRAEPDVLQSFLEREVGPEAKEAIVTPGQRLIEQGVQQGKVQGEREILLRLLRQRFGNELDPETERRIAVATATEIESWALRVLSAATLDDVLAN